MEVPSTQPIPRSTLCHLMYGQHASAAWLLIIPCAPAFESPATSACMCRMWGHVPTCPRQDAQISPATLGLRLLRHNVHM